MSPRMPFWLEIDEEKQHGSIPRLSHNGTSFTSPLRWVTNSDRPYASAYHSPRISSSRAYSVSASQRPIETVRKETDVED